MKNEEEEEKRIVSEANYIQTFLFLGRRELGPFLNFKTTVHSKTDEKNPLKLSFYIIIVIYEISAQ